VEATIARYKQTNKHYVVLLEIDAKRLLVPPDEIKNKGKERKEKKRE